MIVRWRISSRERNWKVLRSSYGNEFKEIVTNRVPDIAILVDS